jgi:antirestriction protein ArdC
MSRHTTRVRASNDRASLYTEITDKIIAELEAGRIPWVQPWGDGGNQGATRDAAQRCHAARIRRDQRADPVGCRR